MRRVLLVDDEPALVRVLARDVRSLGWEVVTCTDALTAIELAATATFDAILTDLNLALPDETILARALADVVDGTPIVVVTGESDEELIGERAGAHIAAIVHKPWRRDEIAEALARNVRPLPLAV